MPVDSTITEPLSSQAILALVAALGLSSTAGLRAVATLFAIGLVSDVTIGGKPLLELNGNFHVLGSTPMLILLGVLTVVEFLVDKFPVLDHVNDIIHTVVRPVVGAVIVAGTTNSLSDTNVWIAAAVGAALAFGVHATKATTRVASTTTTAGVGNPVVSIGEDLLTLASIILVVIAKAIAIAVAPVLGLIVLVVAIIVAFIVALLAWRISSAIYRFFKGSAAPAAQASAGSMAYSGEAPRGLND
jgi:hypothetical protein